MAGRAAAAAVRPITRGPKFHWFGYYDKLQFDPTSRYVLGMEVDFEHRSPRPDDVIKVGMVDLHDGDRWIELGKTRAWNWQQGCMLQWLPGSTTEVIWNDRQRRTLRQPHPDDVRTRQGARRFRRRSIRSSPDGKSAIYPDFRRLNDCRPGYGYAGLPDPNRDDAGPRRCRDLEPGPGSRHVRTLIPFRQVERDSLPQGIAEGREALVQSPALHARRLALRLPASLAGDGRRQRFATRMFTAEP